MLTQHLKRLSSLPTATLNHSDVKRLLLANDISTISAFEGSSMHISQKQQTLLTFFQLTKNIKLFTAASSDNDLVESLCMRVNFSTTPNGLARPESALDLASQVPFIAIKKFKTIYD